MDSDWIGRKVRLLFQDTEKIISKVGIIKKADNVFVEIELESNKMEIIPMSRVVRLEVLK